ncbi:hypothetical protein EWM64_g6895 [Hericium alpestre]|uniref:BTB domain-containing protein n=1 Tax=Hericium alpestre TaxID=135208 RepID=A0A4Y9ZSA9_9AGAM|nr:hypothetical protein EWM64_g6895 [Hericium alpestre]
MTPAPIDADTILRTSDRVNFRVHKLILSFASPVLKDMIKTRQFDSADPGSPQIFDVPEDARTIEYIMRCCYPLPSPSVTALQDLRPVLYAAHKYGMAAVTSLAKVSLERYSSHDVLGVFCVASRCELEDVCAKAATESLHYKLTSLNSVHLDQISARQLHKLLQYHRRHLANASTPAPSVVWCSKNSCVSATVSQKSPPLLDKPICSAAAPFCKGTEDVILRSSYPRTDFYVHKVILSFASPVFRNMFQLGQPAATLTSHVSGAADTIPIIDVTEDPRTLESVLRCIYPVASPIIKGLDHVRLFLEAGRQYDIDVVNTLGKAALVKHIDRDVLGAFAIALRYNFPDVCAMAAKASLRYLRRLWYWCAGM